MNTWHHIAFTYNGTTLTIYKDGIPTASYPVTGTILSSNQTVTIGNVNLTHNRFFNGAIDDVKLYNRALAASEIAALAQGVSSPTLPTIASLDRLHVFIDRVERITLTGSNLTGDFKVEFIKAGTPNLTFSSLQGDTTTLNLDFTTKDLSSVELGEYTVQVTRTTDNQTVTHPKTFVFTRLGDMWKSGATDTTEQKRDGKVDIFDVSRLLSKWNTTDPEADINPGPGRISSGIVDIFDANKLMANWTQ